MSKCRTVNPFKNAEPKPQPKPEVIPEEIIDDIIEEGKPTPVKEFYSDADMDADIEVIIDSVKVIKSKATKKRKKK